MKRLPESWIADFRGPETGGRPFDRRDFLKGLLAAGAGGALVRVFGAPETASAAPTADFTDGVAAGDPRPHGATIWTRLDPPADGAPVPVMWMVGEDASLERVVRGGVVLARAETDHSVKLEVRGLRPDRWYHYRFFARGGASRVGRLRTAPAPGASPDRLRYAFASCQQRSSPYVAHRALAREDIDFFIHLGDYVYVSDSGDLTLEDYRRRWRIFGSDPLLQDLRATVPLVPMWDDGEFYNGVDRTGPPARLRAARSAWFENMPVMRRRDDRIYRSFSWGDLADVFMIDVRSYRDPEVPANRFNYLPGFDAQDSRIPPGEEMFAEERTTLGAPQERWLQRSLRSSRAAWRMIGNPYNMSPWRFEDLDTPEARAADPDFVPNTGIYVSNEAWDDYQAERKALLDFIVQHDVRNVVFNSGHTHFYIASELMPDFDDPDSPTAAVDFVTGSLTADPDPCTIAPPIFLGLVAEVIRAENQPYMKLLDLSEQGYTLVEVTPEACTVEFRGIDSFDLEAEPVTFAKFRVASGTNRIETLFAGPGPHRCADDR